MAQDQFDPDAYLASASQDKGFDPDAYLMESAPPSLTPEQISSQAERARGSFMRGQYPGMSMAADFLRGATETTRGIANLAGAGIEPPKYSKGDSWSGIVGSLFDPAAWAIGGAAGKGVSMLPKVVSGSPIIAGALAGGTGGAAIGGLSDQGTAGGGAMVGAGVGAAIPGAGRVVGGLVDAFKGNSANVKAGRILRETLDMENTASIPALRNAGDVSTTQALGEAGGAKIAGLEQLLRSRMVGATEREIRQEAERISRISKFSGGRNQEEVRAAVENAKKILNEGLDPLRVTGAENANFFTREIIKDRTAAEAARKEAEASVANVRRLEAARQAAERKAQNTYPVAGMPRVSGSITWSDELAKRADAKMTEEAAKSLEKGALARTAEYQLERTAAHGLQELTIDPVIKAINSRISAPGDRTNKVLVDTMNTFKEYAKRFVKPDGTIDAYDLHGLRKNLNDIIDATYPTADDALRKRAAKEISFVRDAIDDALKKSGGDPMVRYFDQFSKGMDKIRQMQLAGEAMGLSENAMVKIAEGNAPKKVEKILGPGKYRLDEAGGVAEALRKNAAEIRRDQLIKEQAKSGSGEAESILKNNMLLYTAPNTLTTTGSIANKVSQYLGRKLNEATEKKLALALENPELANKLLTTLPASERIAVFKAMKDTGNAGMFSGVMAGAAQ